MDGPIWLMQPWLMLNRFKYSLIVRGKSVVQVLTKASIGSWTDSRWHWQRWWCRFIICQSNRSAIVFCNEVGNHKFWIIFRLVGRGKNTDAIGTRIQLSANGFVQTGEVISGGRYLVSNDIRLHFGLADADMIDKVAIRWPNGSMRTLNNIPTRQILTLNQPSL